MKKVLFALNNRGYSKTAFDFIKRMNEQEPVLVTAIYIPAFIDYLSWISPGGEVLYVPRILQEDELLLRSQMEAFKQACEHHNIELRVHDMIQYSADNDIARETRFADLLVIGFEGYYPASGMEYVHEELKYLIRKAECAVMLVPEKAVFPDNIIIAYDGSPSSVFAMKMYSYLFPSLKQMPTQVAFAGLNKEKLPDEEYVTELAARHYTNLSFTILDFEARKYFITWLEERPGALLVTGAYNRSDISQLFRKSFIDVALKDHNIPIFLAHG